MGASERTINARSDAKSDLDGRRNDERRVARLVLELRAASNGKRA
jgi:hypothetical protein